MILAQLGLVKDTGVRCPHCITSADIEVAYSIFVHSSSVGLVRVIGMAISTLASEEPESVIGSDNMGGCLVTESSDI